jgi:predicted TIM-barrel fold metal-dependent hydrolase
MRIDGHLHVFLSQREDPEREVSELAPAGRKAPVELLIETMAAHGVDGAVLVPLGPERAYVARCLDTFPDHFVGVCVADESLHADPARRLRERAAAGFLGVRMSRLGEPGRPLRESPVYPTLAAMAAEGLVLWQYAPPDQLPLLREAIELLPELTVCLNHLGFSPERMDVDEHGRPRLRTTLPPSTLPAVLELAALPHVHVMLSGLYGWSDEPYPYRDLTGVVQALYESYGAKRLLWASDFPWILEEPGYGAVLELPDRHLPNLTDAERADVFGGTVAQIFPRGWGHA